MLSEIELILKSRPLNQLCDVDTGDILMPSYLGINCTKSIQVLNTVMKNFKSICQNVLNMSKIQLNIFGKDGEQNMSRH